MPSLIDWAAEELAKSLADYKNKGAASIEMVDIEFTVAEMLVEDAAKSFDGLNRRIDNLLRQSNQDIDNTDEHGKSKVNFAIKSYGILFVTAAVLSFITALFMATMIRKQITAKKRERPFPIESETAALVSFNPSAGMMRALK